MNRELLFSVTRKDFEIQYFSGTGSGGQHRNKHQNCVRLRHRASGAASTGQSNKERKQNRTEAFLSLVHSAQFQAWHREHIQEICTGKTIEQQVEELMEPENLKIEYRIDGRWRTQ